MKGKSRMYIIPGYVKIRKEKDESYLFSELLNNKVRIFQPDLKQELENLVEHGCDKLSTPLTKFLYEQELLAKKEEIVENLNNFRDTLNKYLMLTIMPTENCNFRCPYCYEHHMAINMDEKNFKHIQSYIKTQAMKDFKMVQINWFGGEPTLCKDKVISMGEYIQGLQKEYSFDYFATMTTNGYLLDLDSFKKYYKTGVVGYQITLDGWNHNKTRPHVTGKGTLEAILSNLKNISKLPKESFNFNIILRYNILPDSNDFTWYDYLKKLFGTDDRFSILIRPVSDWGGDGVKELSILDKVSAENAVKKHLKYIEKIGLKHVNGNRNDVFAKICYANYPYGFVFRACGKIEKCTVCLDHPQNNVGYIDKEKGVLIKESNNKLWSNTTFPDKCLRCPSVLSCLNMRCRKQEILTGIVNDNCENITSITY